MKELNEQINDEWIIKNMFDKKGRINSNKVQLKYLNKNLNIKNYIDNRFSDSNNYNEILYRIKNKIYEIPKCPICGNKCNYNGHNYSIFCSYKCQYSYEGNKLTQSKVQQTSLNKYGVLHFTQSEEVKRKIKDTNIERFGVDVPMKSRKIVEKMLQTNLERYGSKIYARSEDYIQKNKQTNLEKYGVEYANQNKNVREKIQQTCYEKYGNICNLQGNEIKGKIIEKWKEKYGYENPLKNKEIIEKSKQTKLEKYGDINYNNREKCKETCIKKYGVSNPQKIEFIKEKVRLTNLERYGETSHMKTQKSRQYFSKLMQSPDVQKKQLETKRKRGSFKISKIEQQFKEYLEQNYSNDFEYQYRSELYPFNCDFYIKSLDLYIEIQGIWFHGNHPFDENNINDILYLNHLKEKSKEKGINGKNKYQYETAIHIWTVNDVKKRNIAKENNLNYLEIFSNNIEICIQKLNTYVNNKKCNRNN